MTIKPNLAAKCPPERTCHPAPLTARIQVAARSIASVPAHHHSRCSGARKAPTTSSDAAFTLATHMPVLFAHPGSPRERRTNENTVSLGRAGLGLAGRVGVGCSSWFVTHENTGRHGRALRWTCPYQGGRPTPALAHLNGLIRRMSDPNRS